MPEPKNYANWRARVGTVVAAASDGSFRETWALPDGRTFRVTGRPHPDGAVAFMFEDISHEISLTRSFRSELALGASVLNALDQSIAVFGPDGRLEFSNAQFQAACALPNTIAQSDHKLAHAQAHWKRQFAPSPALAQFLAELAEPDGAFQGVLTGKDQTKTDMRLHPLAGGMRMVAFQPVMAERFATPA
jgi:PAS domain-containing protein